MGSHSYGIDRRQRVNLSDEAFAILISDSFTLANDNIISYSEMISRIFLMQMKRIDEKCQGMDRFAAFLAKKPSRGQTKTPSLRNGVLEYLSRSNVKEIIASGVYGGSPGKFVKAVIEEYAEKPFIERERIFFHDTVKKIDNNRKKLLQIVTGSRVLVVKPYEIMPDKQSTYNYLTCFSMVAGEPIRYITASFRISRIKDVAVIQDSEFILSYGEEDEIKQAILEKGVQFLRGDLCEIIIEFSDKGKSFFNTRVFQRPEVKLIEGNRYHFYCTIVQADYYFFKFGAEAKVIEPIKLRDTFAKRYKEAVVSYEW